MSASPTSESAASDPGIAGSWLGIRITGGARGERARTLAPLGLYAVLAVGVIGTHVIRHLGSRIIAVNDLDPGSLMWMLAWWPHALLHGLNPFVTHAILYPDGYNLTWATSMPLPSIVLAPITLGFGSAVSWNVLQLLCPALSAWTAFLLCRHVVGRPLPALVGGYMFGFSPYVLAHLETSPNLALVALLPVFVLLVVKHVEGLITARRFVIAMTLALAAQFLISTEVLVTSILFGAVALLAAFALFKTHRLRLLRTIGLLVLAGAATAVLVSPYLYYFLFGQHYPPPANTFGADLGSFVLPPAALALQLHGGATLVGSNLEEYLGAPLVLLIVLFAVQRRRSRVAVLLVFCALLTIVLSLGGYGLDVGGHVTSIWMPWGPLAQLPVLRYAIPARFSVFVILPAAVIMAMWLENRGAATVRGARRAAVARWGLALLAVAFILPDVGNSAWNTPISDPAFFQHGTYRRYLTSSDHVLTIPAWGPSQRWVADAGFPFALSAGSGGQGFPSSYSRYPIWNPLLLNWTFEAEQAFPLNPLPVGYASQLRQFVTAERVTAIVVQQGFPGPWRTLLASLGVRPITTGGVVLYRLDRRRGSGT